MILDGRSLRNLFCEHPLDFNIVNQTGGSFDPV
jgi:hypothetical protein